MHKSKSIGNRGQAASLDLAVFVAITVLVLSYLFIQSIKYGSSEAKINENENINEIAIQTLSALAQSSSRDIVLKTVQPISLSQVNSSFAEDIRALTKYSGKSLDALSKAEKQANNGASGISKDPNIFYLKWRAEDIDYYLAESKKVVLDIVDSFIAQALSEKDSFCDASNKLSSFFSGYSDLSKECDNASEKGIIDYLTDAITNAQKTTSDLTGSIEDSIDGADTLAEDELAEYLHKLRCDLQALDEKTKAVLSYLQTGSNLDVSFLELWPVEANVEGMTLKEILGDSATIGDKFIFSDETRSAVAMAGLFFLRSRDMGTGIFDFEPPDRGNKSLNGGISYEQLINLFADAPLVKDSNTSASGPYGGLFFGTESYLTASGKLAVRLKFWGDGLGGIKQKTKYFETADYIIKTPVYFLRAHNRTYDGSYAKGNVTEKQVIKTQKIYRHSSKLNDEISVEQTIEQIVLLRPFEARPYLVYENTTLPTSDYSFRINHSLLETDSDYRINLSPKTFEYNESDASKSIILGMIHTTRGSLFDQISTAVKKRLDELLEGYKYKFEARDCCRTIIEINADLDPHGEVGTARYYFVADGARGEMKLTVFR